MTLLKVQRPLGGTDMSDCLVYDERQAILFFAPYDDGAKKLFEEHGNPLKLYVEANVITAGYQSRYSINSIPKRQSYDW
jgi:hypothetical protein